MGYHSVLYSVKHRRQAHDARDGI